jgi:hypothetical protein
MKTKVKTMVGRTLVPLLLAAAALAGAPAAAGGDRWIHVRVLDRAAGEHSMSLNLPVSTIAAVLPTIGVDGDQLDLGLEDDFDLRELVAALRDSADADIVRLREADGMVSIAKESDRLVVRVDDRGSPAENLRIVVPLRVLDAMIDETTGEIDLVRGLNALGDWSGDLVHIESEDESVRVWVDGRSEGR